MQDRATAVEHRGVHLDGDATWELDPGVEIDEAEVALRWRLAGVQAHRSWVVEGSLPMVSRPSNLRECSARGIWNGDRADRCVDLRIGTRP